MATKYKKISYEYECEQFSGTNYEDMQELGDCSMIYNKEISTLTLNTLSGDLDIKSTEWLVARLDDSDNVVEYTVYTNDEFQEQFIED
jgi:hypothetical protein